MNTNVFPAQQKRGLRWKLALSYTSVTVAALITVEFILLLAASVTLFILVNSGRLPTQLIDTTSVSITPILRAYLSQSPPDVEGMATWLEQFEIAPGSIPLSFDATDRVFVVGPEGELLAVRPAGLFNAAQLGQPLDPQLVPGLAKPLAAALDGENDPYKLFTLRNETDQVVLATPIWDAEHKQVLGVVVGLADYPTLTSVLGDALPVLGISLLLLTIIAGLIGTLFGYLAARGPIRRLNRLSDATLAWSQGDFTTFVTDTDSDELGQLAQRLNHMAQELELLLKTRREFAVVEERNRLARELHDSAKQQAFAAAAQIGGVRALLPHDPAAAKGHLAEAENIIDQLRQELNSLIFELRPAALDNQGIAVAAKMYIAEWSKQNNIQSQLRLAGERPLPLDIEQALFRIVQESLANVARHSGANSVEIALVFQQDDVILTVADDGHGFDQSDASAGFGLQSMAQRAEALGGQFSLEAAQAKGTALSCKIPIPHSNGSGQERAHE